MVCILKSGKKQLTIPTFKKGSGTSIEDWRPVRHVQEFGKVCESIIAEQIIDHFETGQMWHESLHRGIKGMSTFSACADIEDRQFDSHDRGLVNATHLVDQKSAYNIISHDILFVRGTTFPPQPEIGLRHTLKTGATK